ncbi:MAG: hypothetical protein E7231_12735 [Cellulosilyticum sp.]|nr:hypothetical protein [Cellulosilyticum sp.]
MSEVFKEYLIKQKKSSKDVMAQTGLVLGAVILSIIVFIIGGDFIGPVLIVGIIFGTGFLFNKFSREYEYILTNNELDIDVIYNRNTRKRVLTVDMKKIEVMASIKDERHTSAINKQGLKVINASDNKNEEATYAIITDTEKSGMCKILITPNSTLLNELYKQAPNKVMRKNTYGNAGNKNQ